MPEAHTTTSNPNKSRRRAYISARCRLNELEAAIAEQARKLDAVRQDLRDIAATAQGDQICDPAPSRLVS